ncbi:low specificity L-threonine aldolase [Nocardioides sp. YIM 152588]|uniref:threonine aldolase family protein n=1 Tax=Nocardioides sp. YIM 152588 TaxID=3158259 RepID=UPI0032E46DD0
MADQPSPTAAHRRHDPEARHFASDNYAGVHPEVLAALATANGGHAVSYGEDPYSEHLQGLMSGLFGAEVAAYPVFNGTGANVLALQAVTDRWGSVICAETAHINCDEGGAPEQVAGLKLHAVPTPDGKLTPELVDRQAWGFDDEHRAMPQAVSITQSTELGTLYTPDEVRALADHVHGLGMRLHLDGARLANAAAALEVPVREFTSDAGVDILSFGATKNGALGAEAVVIMDPSSVARPRHLRKRSMQLASKMRFLSVQFEALLADGLWLRLAGQANAMAQRLADGVAQIDGVEILYPVQANAVFARLPHEVTRRLQERHRFYFWDEAAGDVRWMCSYDTTAEDVDGFLDSIRAEIGR